MPRLFPYSAAVESRTRPCKAPYFNGWVPRSDDALCAELARLAYCGGATVQAGLAAVSMTLVAEFSGPDGKGTNAYLAKGGSKAILAFRGTQDDDPTDVIDDLRILPVPCAMGGHVHVGFSDAVARVWPAIKARLDGLGSSEILFTGHSLGAALATVAASLFTPKRLITFGSPRVGDAAFCTCLASRTTHDRYVNCCDLVAQVPPIPYQPAGRLRYINRDGEIHDNPTDSFMINDQMVAHATYVRDYAWRFGNEVTRSLADHGAINYVSAIAGAAK